MGNQPREVLHHIGTLAESSICHSTIPSGWLPLGNVIHGNIGGSYSQEPIATSVLLKMSSCLEVIIAEYHTILMVMLAHTVGREGPHIWNIYQY